MTKQDLIDMLEFVEDDAEIMVAVQTGNYWRMVAVKPITSLDQMPVKHSDYLDSLELVDDEDGAELAWVIELG